MNGLRSGRRGFTLIEMVVAVAILGIMAAIAVPNIYRMSRRGALRASASGLVSALKLARSSAASGRLPPGGTVRTAEAGVRFDSATRYDVFLDADRVASNGNEAVLRSYDLTDDNPSFRLDGQPAEVRYQRNGMLTVPGDVVIRLQDPDTDLEYTVRATFGGRVEIQN